MEDKKYTIESAADMSERFLWIMKTIAIIIPMIIAYFIPTDYRLLGYIIAQFFVSTIMYQVYRVYAYTFIEQYIEHKNKVIDEIIEEYRNDPTTPDIPDITEQTNQDDSSEMYADWLDNTDEKQYIDVMDPPSESENLTININGEMHIITGFSEGMHELDNE